MQRPLLVIASQVSGLKPQVQVSTPRPPNPPLSPPLLCVADLCCIYPSHTEESLQVCVLLGVHGCHTAQLEGLAGHSVDQQHTPLRVPGVGTFPQHLTCSTGISAMSCYAGRVDRYRGGTPVEVDASILR